MKKPTGALTSLINHVNSFNDDNKSDDQDNLPYYKFRDTAYKVKSYRTVQSKILSLFHFKICSLQKKYERFCAVLYELDTNLYIIVITMSRIRNNSVFPTNVALSNYSKLLYTTTESSACGALLYINQRLADLPRIDLNNYVPIKFEWVFIVIICPKSSKSWKSLLGAFTLGINESTNQVLLEIINNTSYKKNPRRRFSFSWTSILIY